MALNLLITSQNFKKEKKMRPKKILRKDKVSVGKMESSVEQKLRNQYVVIRDDLKKLRDDLQEGYDMAKEIVEKKNILGSLMKK
jgi:hypothetical protein